MAEIKLITTDLDGTFLMDHANPHPDNVAAVAECRKRGIHVCACTGRPWGNTKLIVEKGGLQGLCAVSNGASIIDTATGKHRFRRRLDPQKVRDILAFGIEAKAEVMVLGYTTLYIYRPHMGEMMKEYVGSFKDIEGNLMQACLCDTLDELHERSAEDAEKVDFAMNVHDSIEEVWDKLNQITEVEITSSVPGNMEISAKDGSKQNAISVLADIYGVDAENVMALGDNFNDMSMIMWAGIGVAMGNADYRLKSMANHVTGRNYEGGVAQAIYELVLNK